MELFCELRELISNLDLNRTGIAQSVYSDRSIWTDMDNHVVTTFLNDTIMDICAFQVYILNFVLRFNNAKRPPNMVYCFS